VTWIAYPISRRGPDQTSLLPVRCPAGTARAWQHRLWRSTHDDRDGPVAASGLPRIRPMQDLRHTHATLLIGEGGVNVKVIQERLDHHSHSLTADT